MSAQPPSTSTPAPAPTPAAPASTPTPAPASSTPAKKDGASSSSSSFDLKKVLCEVAVPAAAVAAVVVLGVVVRGKCAGDKDGDGAAGKKDDGAVSNALSLFKAKPVEDHPKEVEKSAKKAAKEVDEDKKNPIEEFGDWLKGLFAKKE